MSQLWQNLVAENITPIDDSTDYTFSRTNYIVLHNNRYGQFVMYMPSSKSFISATTAIKFHDCYKVGDTGYAHASFAFIAPGYLAGFPISFGFAGVNKSNSVWIIGQKQVYTRSDSTYTYWNSTLETSFGWPTEPLGVVPFISVGGVPFYQRYSGTATNTAIKYYEGYSGGNIKTYTKSVQSTNIANDTNGDNFASNAFNVTYDTWKFGAKALCPVDFTNWVENADSSFIGGWKNRQGFPQGYDDAGNKINKYLGVGTVFATNSNETYGSKLVFDNAAFSCAVKVWVYDSAGKPQRAKQVYVYNSSGAPVKAKHLYVYNSSGVPVQVF